MTWISVTERLPEITDPADGDPAGGFSDYVLVWPMKPFDPPMGIGTYSELRQRFELPNGDEFDPPITHWMVRPLTPDGL